MIILMSQIAHDAKRIPGRSAVKGPNRKRVTDPRIPGSPREGKGTRVRNR